MNRGKIGIQDPDMLCISTYHTKRDGCGIIQEVFHAEV